MSSGVETGRITTDIPARLDRLPWARWHWLVVIGLGTVWILDGLEVTIVGSMSAALQEEKTGLGLSSFDVGLAGAVYVAGACLGALFFGQLTDRFGRKKLFLLTLAVYTVAGLIYGIAAWVLIGRAGAATPNAVPDANLQSITAVVIGGTSLFGGRGIIIGSLLGALIVGVFRNGLALAGVDVLWQTLVVGLLVIVAVATDQWIRRVRA